MSNELTLLETKDVPGYLNPEEVAQWVAACACLDSPSEETLSKFRKLCGPGHVLLLLRVVAENNRSHRLSPFRTRKIEGKS